MHRYHKYDVWTIFFLRNIEHRRILLAKRFTDENGCFCSLDLGVTGKSVLWIQLSSFQTWLQLRHTRHTVSAWTVKQTRHVATCRAPPSDCLLLQKNLPLCSQNIPNVTADVLLNPHSCSVYQEQSKQHEFVIKNCLSLVFLLPYTYLIEVQREIEICLWVCMAAMLLWWRLCMCILLEDLPLICPFS